jgi:hypothetical protein
MKSLAVLAALLAVTGCISMTQTRRELSAGFVGCAPEKIDVTEESNYAWVSSCDGRRFRCSSTGMGAACTPDQTTAPSSASAPTSTPAP